MIFFQKLTCGRLHDENFNDANLRKITTSKNERVLAVVSKRKITLANKIVILVEKLLDFSRHRYDNIYA